MTSTPFNVGLGDGSRMSSRVLRPPGGGHTDIFGGEPEPPRGRRRAPPGALASANPDPTGASPVEPAVPATNGSEQPKHTGKENQPSAEPRQENAPSEVDSSQNKAEPAKRVRVPPGGFSSGLW